MLGLLVKELGQFINGVLESYALADYCYAIGQLGGRILDILNGVFQIFEFRVNIGRCSVDAQIIDDLLGIAFGGSGIVAGIIGNAE